MSELDAIRINFNQSQLFLLNFCLGFLMFGVAIELSVKDFKALLSNVKGTIVGLCSQMILLPLLTLGLIYVIKPEPSLAMGMLLVSACPGGNVSNYAVHLSKANAPLSVLLTSISTLMAALSTPLVFKLGNQMISSGTTSYITISFWSMFTSIFQLILIPLIIGIILNHWYPSLTKKIIPSVKKLSLVIFIAFILFAIAGNMENIKQHLHHVFYIVIIHNSLALGAAYYFARWMGRPKIDARAISIETGIQNSGLALILVFNFFNGNGGMALIAAWWSIWHLISSFTLAMYWRRN